MLKLLRLSLKDGKLKTKHVSVLTLLGKVEIQDGLYGAGFLKANSQLLKTVATDNNDGDIITNRYTYAGLGGTSGELTVRMKVPGRNHRLHRYHGLPR